MIAIIDYRAGNLQSVQRALAFLNADCRFVAEPDGLDGCDKILLPGVGAFGAAMNHLNQSGLTSVIRNWLKADKPFLGICLGMQMLFDKSEEDPGIGGLGFFPGQCREFRSGKVPQIGWNDIRSIKKTGLLTGFAEHPYFYFLHSFYSVPEDRSIISGVTNYGLEYPSIVQQGRVSGVQFHPEKSGDKGIELMRNWTRDQSC
jgi:imidazole glycerol phosphate synthase glutamine amidotransferase subunit